MTEVIHLDISEPIEVRDFEKREIAGRIIPYGETIEIRGKPESFTKGVLSEVDVSKTKLLRDHDPRNPLGKAVAIEERNDGAYAVWRISKTTAGNEALELARDGLLSFSPGFIPGTQTREGVHTRMKALPEVSLVTFAAYVGGEVISVRSDADEASATPEPEEVPSMSETAPVVEPFDPSNLEARMADIAEQMVKLEVAHSAPTQKRAKEIRPADWFVAAVHAQFRNDSSKLEKLHEALETRAIDDAVGVFAADSSGASDAAGLIENSYLVDQMVNVLDASRPLFARAGKLAMPRSGVALIPNVTQHNTSAVRASQAAEPESTALVVQTKSYTAKWFDSSLQVSYELMATAEMDVLELVFNDMLRAYGAKTEAQAIIDIEAAITAFGGALDTTNYGTFAVDVATQAMEVRAATGLPATKLAVPLATWPTLVSFVDADDRRGLGSNDAAISLTAESFGLPGGIEVFAAGVTKAILFNEAALRTAEDAPLKLEATNVAQVMRDVAILGRTLIVPRILPGIVYFDVEPSSSSSS